jgi:Ca2+-binding RTX toxin-like protein
VGPPPEGPVVDFVFDEQGLQQGPVAGPEAGTTIIPVSGSGETKTAAAAKETFVFESTAGSGNANANTITGFSPPNDVLDFTKGFLETHTTTDSLVTNLTSGTIAANQFLTGAGTTAAANGNQLFIYNSTNGKLYFDADGNGGGESATLVVTLDTAIPTITFNDISVT